MKRYKSLDSARKDPNSAKYGPWDRLVDGVGVIVAQSQDEENDMYNMTYQELSDYAKTLAYEEDKPLINPHWSAAIDDGWGNGNYYFPEAEMPPLPELACKHSRTKVVPMIQTKFILCLDCKKDLGNV